MMYTVEVFKTFAIGVQLWFLEMAQATLTDRVQTNHTAGAAFTTETPVIIASAMEATWVSIPFPSLPAMNKIALDLAFREFQYKLAKRWEAYGGHICGEERLTSVLVNVSYMGLKGVEYELNEIAKTLTEMRERAGTFINGSEGTLARERRWVKVALAGATAAIVLTPLLKEGFCHYFSFFGFCGQSSALQQLGNEAEFLDEAVRTITLESGERIHLLGHSLNKTQHQLRLISRDANQNFRMILDVLEHLVKETGRQSRSWSRQCKTHKALAETYREGLAFTSHLVNHTEAMTALRSELIAYKVGLHNYGYVLDDALSSLALGYIPATLIPPEVLRNILDGLHRDKMQEAIPRSELMTYYGFELVESTVITKTGLNVLINIPVHYTNGLHRVYRAVAVPQPIDNGATATQYNFARNHLLVSERRDNFAEVTEEMLISHCSGSNRLKLCLKPFSMSRSGQATCLSSLFFDLPSSALKLCPHKVVVLPDEPKADYLDNSTYLVTAKTADYKLFNYTRGSKQPGLAVEGCRSCLVRPHCNGRIEHPSGSMILYPDPRTCQYPTGMVINIQQHPLMKSLFGTLERVEREATGIAIPKPFREKAHEELLETLRLNLIDLPEGTIDEKAMEEIARPFAEEIVKRHAPFHWRAYHSRPMNVIFWIIVAVCFCLAGLWSFRKCTQGQNPFYKRMRPPPSYVERFHNTRRQWFPSTAPPEDVAGPSGHEQTRLCTTFEMVERKNEHKHPLFSQIAEHELQPEADKGASPSKAKAGGVMRGLVA